MAERRVAGCLKTSGGIAEDLELTFCANTRSLGTGVAAATGVHHTSKTWRRTFVFKGKRN